MKALHLTLECPAIQVGKPWKRITEWAEAHEVKTSVIKGHHGYAGFIQVYGVLTRYGDGKGRWGHETAKEGDWIMKVPGLGVTVLSNEEMGALA